jgi:transketolase
VLADGGPRADRWRRFQRQDDGEAQLAEARQALRKLSFEGAVATRVAAGKAQAALAGPVPGLVGGSADLANSTKTDLFEKAVGYLGDGPAGSEPAPRGVHFGVREHAMASIANGLALHGGWLPYAGTFLVFSDYLRGAIRLGAISGLPVTYVLTHDSVFLGEDGETHQPVEHVESLRLIPGVEVVRPADAYEAVEAWLYALARHLGPDPAPVVLVLSRQDLPILPGGSGRAQGLHQGGYLVHGEAERLPDLELIASGSEVDLALRSARLLEATGTLVRVVSMPCREAFARLPRADRDRVLHPDCPFKVVIEAGRIQGWSQLAGYPVEKVGIDQYGESGPLPELQGRFGFTPEALAERLRSYLDGRREVLAQGLRGRLAYLRARMPESARELLEDLRA